MEPSSLILVLGLEWDKMNLEYLVASESKIQKDRGNSSKEHRVSRGHSLITTHSLSTTLIKDSTES